MPVTWNLWHGCRKLSAGCANCYVYRTDLKHGRNPETVQKTASFDLPLRRNRAGGYKIPSGELVYTCFTSDFLLEEADSWRPAAWEMIRQRQDLTFLFVTKRIHRLEDCLPDDWGEGYPNLHICCTCENQDRADARLPIFRKAPILHKSIVCEPLLGPIDLSAHLGGWVEEVVAGGESGNEARLCDYEWVLDLRRQCVQAGVAFHFKQTGARFRKDGRLYRIERKYQHSQARRANIDYGGREKWL